MINQFVRKARKMFKAASSAKNVRSDYYYSRIYFKRMLQFFKSLNEAAANPVLKQTETAISPLGLKFGITVQQVKKEFGKEKYSYENGNGPHNHRVLFYRRSYSDISLLVQLQFYNNRLFFIGLDVIRRLINEDEKAEIINTVIQKYLHQPFTKGQAYPLISDPNNNLIIINDDINFSICYLPGNLNPQTQQNIEKAMDNVLQDEKPDKGSLFYAF